MSKLTERIGRIDSPIVLVMVLVLVGAARSAGAANYDETVLANSFTSIQTSCTG